MREDPFGGRGSGAILDFVPVGDGLMWVFTNKGFLSIVQHNSMPDYFQVKSRVIDPLEILWPDHEIEVIDWADYRFRITIEKSEVLPILLEVMASVDYTSFKDECRDEHDYHEVLCRIWSQMYNYQRRVENEN